MSLVGRTFALTDSKIPYYDKLVVAKTDGALFEDADHVQYNKITVYQNGTRDYYKASNSSRVNVFYCNWDDTCGWNDPAYKTITFLADPDSINIGTSPYLTTLDDFKEWLGTYSDEVLPVPYLTNDQELTSIANAIREKGGTSASLAFPAGFVSAIEAIPSGGGGSSDGDVIFIDYDGTVVDAKTKAQINAMTSDSDLPANPTHTGLTAQGWNWTVAQLKAQLTAMPDQKVYVGQMYITTSGATEIDVEMHEGRLDPVLTIAVNGEVSVDWGDNTTPDTVTGASETTMITVNHTYASAGSYTICISKVSGTYSLYANNTYTLLQKGINKIAQNRVYANCIQSIRIGTGVTKIGDYTFYYCCSLASITIPSSVTSIGYQAFYYCCSLANITIPSSVTSIGSSAFYYCYSLANITIPSSVTSIENSTFTYCCPLASITIPSSVTSIGSQAFYNCISLANITIPSSVTSIGNKVFYYCYALASVTIPSSVTSIGSSVFYNCYSLASITIPSSVTSIEENAFQACYGVKEYHIQPTSVPTAGTTIFNNIVSDTVIYVPYSSDHSILEAYKTASNWSTYASYMQEEPQS